MAQLKRDGVKEIEIVREDLDAQPQDKDVKKIKGTQPKKYYKKIDNEKEKEQSFLENKNIKSQMMMTIIKYSHTMKKQRLRNLFTLKSLIRCTVVKKNYTHMDIHQCI